MTESELQAIEQRWAMATPGPWFWDVNKACREILLESAANRVVMGFKRYGMGGAQPTFLGALEIEPAETLAVPRKAHHPNFDMDIIHPDAQAIASAPADIAALLAEVERLNERIEKMKSEACPPVHCMDGIKCSECWDWWLTTVCNEMREKEAAGNG